MRTSISAACLAGWLLPLASTSIGAQTLPPAALSFFEAPVAASQPIPQREEPIRAMLKAADDVFNSGDRQRALQMIADAQLAAFRILGPDAELTLNAELDYAATLMHLGQLDLAKTALAAVLERTTRLLGERHPLSLDTLNNYANLIAESEGGRAALPFYERAYKLRAASQGETDINAINSLSDMAYGLMTAGELHRALPLMKRVIDLRLRSQGETHAWTFTAYNNLGVLYERLGRAGDARKQHELALRLRLKYLGERHPETLVSMNNLARTLGDFGATDEAIQLISRTLALETEVLGAKHFSTLDARQNLANFWLEGTNKAQAIETLRGVILDRLQTQSADHPNRLSALISLARALAEVGITGEALLQLDEAEAGIARSLGPDHPMMLSARQVRAQVLLKKGDAADAAQLTGSAAAQAEKLLGSTHDQTLELRALQAAAQFADKDQASNVAAVQRSIEAVVSTLERIRGGLPAHEVDVRQRWQHRHRHAYQLAVRVLLHQGEGEQALTLLAATRARNLRDALGDRELALAAGISVGEWQAMQEQRERLLALGAMLSRGQLAQDRQALLAARADAQAQVYRLENDLAARHPQYAFDSQGPKRPGNRFEDFAAPGVSTTTEALSSKPKAPKAGKQSETAHISFALLEQPYAAEPETAKRLVAFVRRARQPLAWLDLGSAAGLEDSVMSLSLWTSNLGSRRPVDADGAGLQIVRAAQPGGQLTWRTTSQVEPGSGVWGEAAYRELTRSLSARLLTPLQPHLAQTKRWVISADPILARLPWDVLPWQDTTVGERITALLSLGPADSARASDGTSQAPRHARSLWAMGNPEFADEESSGPAMTRGQPRKTVWRLAELPASRLDARGQLALAQGHWPQLNGAAAELQASAKHFTRHGGSARVWAGRQATESQLRRSSATGELARADVLLFSTHAFFNPQVPQRSAIVLRREGETSEDDGYLTPGEIIGLNLDASLTVLSACSTAQGASTPADAAAGFAYALRLAGSRASLLTLWPVSDAAASAFVQSLLGRVAAGTAPEQALHLTKREFMGHRVAAWRSPRYWAPFVLYSAP